LKGDGKSLSRTGREHRVMLRGSVLFVPAWAVDFGRRREKETKLRVSVWIGDSEGMWEKGGDRRRRDTVSFLMGFVIRPPWGCVTA